MTYTFDHVHIICGDLPGMVDYFTKVFEGEVVFRDDNFHGAPNVVMRLGGATLFLRGVRPGETPGGASPDAIMGVDHFSLAVDDAAKTAAGLKSRGADFIREPAPSGMGGRTTAFIRGPEDIRIELSERSGETYRA
jgi:catechol 2,3-dioxygenase-like lactoylglutathione lyase family enzyme